MARRTGSNTYIQKGTQRQNTNRGRHSRQEYTNRQTDREAGSNTKRQTYRQAHRQTDNQHTQAGRGIPKHTYIQQAKKTGSRQTDSQTARHTNTQKIDCIHIYRHVQTGRQADTCRQ